MTTLYQRRLTYLREYMYTVLYIGWITNKDLPCSTGNAIQYLVITCNWKRIWEKKKIYIYI